MAVAFDAVGPSASGTNSTTSPLTWSHTCGASATVLLVGVSVDPVLTDTLITVAVTYNGVTMTSLERWESGGAAEDVGFEQVFYLESPPTGTAHTVSVAVTGATFDLITGGSVSFSGSTALSAATTSDSGGAGTGTGSIAVPTTSANNMVIAFVCNGSSFSATPFTAGTERFVTATVDGDGAAANSAAATIAATGSNVTISWTQQTDFYAAIGVEVQAGGGSSPAPFHQFRQAVRARLPKFPVLCGRKVSNPGAPVRNPVPGPVFRQAISAVRARIPQHIPGGFSNGYGTDTTQASGRIMWSSGAPVKNPSPGPVFIQRPKPVRFQLPPWQPRAGRVGSSFGAPVQNPIHGPPNSHGYRIGLRNRKFSLPPRGRIYITASPRIPAPATGPVFTPAVRAIRAKLPQTPFLRGRMASIWGAPVQNPSPGPVFIQASSPCRSHPHLPSRGQISSNRGTLNAIPSSGPVLHPQGLIRARILQSFSKGRISFNSGVVHNPVPGPVFRQANQAIGAKFPQRPLLRGRIAFSSGAPVRNPQSGPVFRQAVHPVRAVIPQVFSKGRTAGNAGSAKNPVQGPVFRQSAFPVRIHASLPLRGRIVSNPGHPASLVTSGPVFRQRAFVSAKLPLSRRGICRAIRFYPLPASPQSGPLFFPNTSPVKAKTPFPPRGRVYSNPGSIPAVPGNPGPVFRPRNFVRAVIPQAFSKGRVYSNPGAPVRNPNQGPPLSISQPIGIRVIYLRIGSAIQTPAPGAYISPVSSQGPPFFPQGSVRAKIIPPRRGTCRAIRFYPGTRNPQSGPQFTQAASPARIRPVLPLRGRIWSDSGVAQSPPVVSPAFRQLKSPVRTHPVLPLHGRVYLNHGAPVKNPSSGPVFRQAVSPARYRITLPPRGRIAFNHGAPVQNPPPPTGGPVFYPVNSAKARLPLPRRGIIRAIRFYPLPSNPRSGPVFAQGTSPVRAHSVPSLRGRIGSSPGIVQPPVPGLVFRQQARSPVRSRPIPPLRGRMASAWGAPVRNPPSSGPVFIQGTSPVRARVIPAARGRIRSNPGGLAAIPGTGPRVYPAKGPVQARRPLPPHGRITPGSKGAPVKNPQKGPVFHPAVHPIRAVILQNTPRGRIRGNPGGPVENIPFATLRFLSGSPYIQWNTGDPEFQWTAGNPET